jgi:hypothetical protein
MINLPPGLDLSFRPQGEIFPTFSQTIPHGVRDERKDSATKKKPGLSAGLFLPEMS